MKNKLRFISYLLITASLFILINLVYCYNTRTDNFGELNKEIFVSILNLIIGFIFFFKSKNTQDEK